MAINDYLKTSSLYVDGNMNFRRYDEKKSYNSWLLGSAKRIELGHEIVPNNETSRPPSWTQTDLNLNHSFVIQPLSSSFHENVCLNTFLSGNIPLETSAVPASASSFYSKTERYITKIYKLTASLGMPGERSFSSVSGSLFGSTATGRFFCSASINVPDYGRLVNIRVWVEAIHEKGLANTSSSLGTTDIALRAPNLRFGNPIPCLNDPKSLQYNNNQPVAGPVFVQLNEAIDCIPLWLGDDRSWGKDYSIRTIFSDGAFVNNPISPIGLLSSGSLDTNLDYTTAYYSPTWTITGIADVTGGFKPWTSDVTASPLNSSAAGSPPQGWLTGPGGTNAVNEWSTTGSNYGPAEIKPAYPLLDTITEIRNFKLSNGVSSSISFKRQGLRGTEINGRWDLILHSDDGSSVILGRNNAIWFRQFRLELTFIKNQDTAKNARFRILGCPYGLENSKRLIRIMSGSSKSLLPTEIASNDSQYSEVYIEEGNSFSRTIGITNNTSSLQSNNWAVFSRITGSLALKISGSNHEHYKYKFLNNEFGTPFLSLTSGSGDADFTQYEIEVNKNIVSDIFNKKALIKVANTLKSVLSSKDTPTLRMSIEEFTSGSI